MARFPGAIWNGEHGSLLMDRYDIFCIHTIVGYAPATAAHVSTNGEGKIYQSRDTRFRSAANLNGNHRVIASENADRGVAFNGMPRGREGIPPLTDAQIEANAQIFAWLHETHGIPLQLCPDSRPGSRGLAYHRQGIDGNFDSYEFPGRVSGGEVWTEHFGKVCPTDLRIAQLPLILARTIEIVNPNTEEQEMAEAMNEIRKRFDKVDKALAEAKARDEDSTARLKQMRENVYKRDQRLHGLVRSLRSEVSDVRVRTRLDDIEGLLSQNLDDGEEG